MEEPLVLTILYTANLRGDIASLPRLFTLLQRLKASASGATLLLDLGKACDNAAWHCQATGGRSMLIVLDGMGFHAANVAGSLNAADRGKLATQVTMALVDESHPWKFQLPSCEMPITITLRNDHRENCLQIRLTPAGRSEIDGNRLRLQEISAGKIGSIQIRLRPSPRIASFEIHDLPTNARPNPTIAAAVEFVEAEARLFQRKQLRDRTP